MNTDWKHHISLNYESLFICHEKNNAFKKTGKAQKQYQYIVSTQSKMWFVVPIEYINLKCQILEWQPEKKKPVGGDTAVAL